MTSNTIATLIDVNFPIPGKDNNSQGFRDNFTAIKDALTTVQTEITELQDVFTTLEFEDAIEGQVLTAMGGGTFEFADPDLGSAVTDFSRLEDVELSNLLDGQVLKYNIEIGKWVNAADAGGFGGGEVEVTTDDLPEGTDNLYFTTDRVRGAVSAGAGITLTDGVIATTITQYTDTLARDSISSTNLSGVTYDNTTGIIALAAIPNSSLTNSSITINGTPVALGGTRTLNTDDFLEGPSNFYLTRSRFQEFFDDLYGDVSSVLTFDSIETAGTRVSNSAVQVAVSAVRSFKNGQTVRIFNALSTVTVSALTSGIIVGNPTKNGFLGDAAGSAIFEYQIAQFDLATGRISAASPPSSVSGIKLSEFNIVNNIALTITRSALTNGILIYRKITSPAAGESTASYNLIAVLGQKEFENSTGFSFIDYYTFNNTAWSRKEQTRNEFNNASGLIHFPLTAPSTASLGWVDTVVTGVDYNTGVITVSQSFNFGQNVIVSNDDTASLQAEINEKIAANIRILFLDPKTYIISTLTIPERFALIGRSKKTKLKKLSWASANNHMITAAANTNQIELFNMSIDGNMQNQYLLDDSVDDTLNYCINIVGTKLRFENLDMDNIIGGGIYTADSVGVFASVNNIANSGLTDLFEYCPIKANDTSQITIANNVMKNFSGPLDVSVSNIAVLNGNTVNNCGSGISVFGATKLISSPNLILGPAGEFIPGPDIFNSEYDSVNIILEKDVNFISDNYVYQEGGTVFDLSINNNRAVISYKINKLTSTDNIEELGEEILEDAIQPILGTDFANGNFRFSIALQSVNDLKTIFAYRRLKYGGPEIPGSPAIPAQIADPNHMGLVYRAFLTEYVPAGTVIPFTEIVQGTAISYPRAFSAAGLEYYEVYLQNASNISLRSRIRFLSHGGTPSLDIPVGTVTQISNFGANTKLLIEYPTVISVVGSGGFITVENTFILAKGKIL